MAKVAAEGAEQRMVCEVQRLGTACLAKPGLQVRFIGDRSVVLEPLPPEGAKPYRPAVWSERRPIEGARWFHDVRPVRRAAIEEAMADTSAPPKRIVWLVPFVVNALFGYLAPLPLGLVWYFLANYPLAALGLTERDPTDNDGILPHLILLGGVGIFIALWAALNLAVRALSRLPAKPYWSASVALLLGPFVVIGLFPAAYGLWKTPLDWL
ncbi:hypothetical protein [Streptosporangium sp. NPDC049376]|uniref:hypothetical protein n=1 Tax=Streptosporangium sp. NPDC049376 TaxID=3366192 RepID=UPI0037896B63